MRAVRGRMRGAGGGARSRNKVFTLRNNFFYRATLLRMLRGDTGGGTLAIGERRQPSALLVKRRISNKQFDTIAACLSNLVHVLLLTTRRHSFMILYKYSPCFTIVLSLALALTLSRSLLLPFFSSTFSSISPPLQHPFLFLYMLPSRM